MQQDGLVRLSLKRAFADGTVAVDMDPLSLRSIVRFLSSLGEPLDVPARSPNRGPPSWKSTVLRRKALGDDA